MYQVFRSDPGGWPNLALKARESVAGLEKPVRSAISAIPSASD